MTSSKSTAVTRNHITSESVKGLSLKALLKFNIKHLKEIALFETPFVPIDIPPILLSYLIINSIVILTEYAH